MNRPAWCWLKGPMSSKATSTTRREDRARRSSDGDWFVTGDLGRFDDEGLSVHRGPAFAILQDRRRDGAARHDRATLRRSPRPGADRRPGGGDHGHSRRHEGRGAGWCSRRRTSRSSNFARSCSTPACRISGCRRFSAKWKRSRCSAPARRTSRACGRWRCRRWRKREQSEAQGIFTTDFTDSIRMKSSPRPGVLRWEFRICVIREIRG
jgi:hypothetical protein